MKILCIPEKFECSDRSLAARVSVSPHFLSNLDQLELTITADYYTAFRRKLFEPLHISAEEYLYTKRPQWQGDLLCPEMAIPRKWTSTVGLTVPIGNRWTEVASAFFHAGRPHCIAPIHFDWDHAWVAHACLTGRKRFFFFPPQAGWLLSPILNTSALCVPKMSPLDRQELLQRLGGFEVVLEAGQGILFPSMYWHGVLYEMPSLAVSVRFEPYAGGRPFAALPRFWLLQRLLWLFFSQGYGPDAEEFLLRYLREFFMHGTWKQRYRRTIALCQAALSNYGEHRGVAVLVAENFSAELALAVQELKIYYQEASGSEHPQDQVREAFDYMFRGIETIDTELGMRLARHALGVRQGLPPKRGIVRVEEEKESLCLGRKEQGKLID